MPSGRSYQTYAKAARNRRSDERTVYDPFSGRYHNVKVFRRSFFRRRLF